MKTKEYQRMAAATRKWREANDCTVKALAIATGSTYEKAHGALALRGRNYRKGVAMEKVFAALKDMGYTVKTEYDKSVVVRAERYEEYGWDIPEELGEKVRKMTRGRWSKGKTIRSITPHLPSRGVFLIATSSHVLCARAGEVHDWTDGRRHRITQVWRIVKEVKK